MSDELADEELVSVVIPALNEQAFIGDCLDSVLKQDYSALQIIVVDSGSTDGTVGVIEKRSDLDPRIELLHNTRRNIPSSLNLALTAARGVWLVRIDAHSTVEPDYIRRAVEHLRGGLWAGVGGRKDGVGRTSAGRAIAVAMGSRFGVGNSTYHHGTTPQEVDHLPFGAYPLALVRDVEGWNEQLVANEDFEFDYRLRLAGGRLLFDPEIVIAWHCRQSIGALFGQYRRYGKGKVDVARLHPESLRLRHYAPPLFVAYAAISGLLSVRHPRRWLVLMAPYGAAVLAASVPTARTLDTSVERAYVPLAFAAMHIGWGVGFWSRLLTSVAEDLAPPSHHDADMSPRSP